MSPYAGEEGRGEEKEAHRRSWKNVEFLGQVEALMQCLAVESIVILSAGMQRKAARRRTH